MMRTLVCVVAGCRPHARPSLRMAASPPPAPTIVDRKGAIKSMQDGFEAALRLEWPDFDGLWLPNPLAHSLLHGAAGHHRGKRVALNSHRVGDLYYLLASSLGPLHLLTKREREIAERFASGAIYKEIAREMGVAPATVRNHLQAAYGKLGVRDKGALATLLAARPGH